MRVHFLAQGRTDSILIIHNGKAMFIDGGYRANGLSAIKYMHSIGIDRLQTYIVTHGHKNHCGCAGLIISEMKPRLVLINRPETRDAMIKYAKKGKERLSIEECKSHFGMHDVPTIGVFSPGECVYLGSDLSNDESKAEFTCIGPAKRTKCTTGQYKENSNSLIIKMEYKEYSMLLTGDTTAAILNGIEKQTPGILKVDVLKNPHHNGALPLKLLKKVDPLWTVICNGKLPAKKYQYVLRQASCYWAVAGKGDKANGDVILAFTENGIASVDS